MADNTGYEQNADYIFRRQSDALQKAIDDPAGNCFGTKCGNIA